MSLCFRGGREGRDVTRRGMREKNRCEMVWLESKVKSMMIALSPGTLSRLGPQKMVGHWEMTLLVHQHTGR